MSDDDPSGETLVALRAHVATLLRTEARLYQTQAAHDRQLALFEKLHELGIRLIGADHVARIGQLATEFATRHLRYDAALVLFSEQRDTPCAVIGFDGLQRDRVAAIESLAIAWAHPIMSHVAATGFIDYAGDAELLPLARVFGPSFTAHALSTSGESFGLLLAGITSGEGIDAASRRGLANLSMLCAATLAVTASQRAIARDRELLTQRVAERTRELSTALEEVTRLSRTDPLTGLANRRAAMEHAEQAFLLARRHGRAFALISLDIDHFKAINDTFGHHAGDAVLVSVARGLVSSVRDSDLVGRIGGEEFLIVLSETAVPFVDDIGERCRRAVHAIDRDAVDRGIPTVTASFGIAIYPEHASDLASLLRCADEALYRAKRRGRDTIVIFDRS